MGKNFAALVFLPALVFGQGGAAPSSVAPLDVGAKFEYRALSAFGPTKIIAVAAIAGYDQATNTPSEWKQGAEGYGKRYASNFGSNVARQAFAFGLEAALHEDPRYFPSGEQGFGKRFKSVLKQSFITRTDSGRNRFAFARVGSALGAGFLTNVWQPRSTDTVGNAMSNFGLAIAGDAGFNFLQEFFPIFRPKELR